MNEIRQALLHLHQVLLNSQRLQAERFGGRMTAAELLQAATDDLRFDWLSAVITALDEALADDDDAGAQAAVAQARALLDPPDPETPFGARYLHALQDDSDAVLAHRDVRAAFGD